METNKYISATPIFSGNDFNQPAIIIGGCGARAGAFAGVLAGALAVVTTGVLRL